MRCAKIWAERLRTRMPRDRDWFYVGIAHDSLTDVVKTVLYKLG